MYEGRAEDFAVVVGWAAVVTVAVGATGAVGFAATVGIDVGDGTGAAVGGGVVGAGAHAASNVVATPTGATRKKLRLEIGIVLRIPPELTRGYSGAFRQRIHFGPGHIRVDLITGCGGGETAVVRGDDPFPPQDACKPANTFGDQFRVLDQGDAV